MNVSRVFFFFLISCFYVILTMDAPSTAPKPNVTIESKGKKICFIAPELFAVSTEFSPQIALYDLKSKKAKSIIECGGPVNDVSQYDNFKKIIVACYDCVHIWDTQTGKPIQSYKTMTHRINSVHAHPKVENIAVAGSTDSSISNSSTFQSKNYKIQVLDFRKKDPLVKQYTEHSKGINMVRVAGDGDYFVSSSEDKTTKIWGWHSKDSHHTIRNVAANDIAYNTQGNRFLICGHYAYRYDAHTAALLATYNRNGAKEIRGSKIENDSSLDSCASTGIDDQELVALGTDDGKIVLFNPENPKAPPAFMKPFEGAVDSLAFCPSGSCLVAGSSSDKIIHVYEVSNPKDRKDSPIPKRSSLKRGCLP